MRKIDIKTTQNVSIEYELAALRDRFLAQLIDTIIVLIASIVLMSFFMTIIIELTNENELSFFFIYVFGPMNLLMIYHFISEIISNGQSIGKRIMNIRVVRLDGQKPSVTDYLLRSLFLMVDFVSSLGVVGAVFIASSLKNQRLGDLAANTSIIKIDFRSRFLLDDILKINTLEDYEVQYPEIKYFGEQDMLLIKSIISRHAKHKNPAHNQVITELVQQIREQLDIQEPITDKIGFLKTLIRDYIVLTR